MNLPALTMTTDMDYKWLAARKLFCTYTDGKRYRCIGCSRMGDVWLTKHSERENGYDLRIDIDDCTEWEVTPNVVIQGPPAGGPAGMESSTT